MDWNDATEGRLRSLWAEGHSAQEIGRRMGVSKNAIVGKAHRLGLAERGSPIKGERIDWTTRDDALREMRANGMSAKTLADRIGVSQSMVHGRLHKLGIAEPPTPPLVTLRPPQGEASRAAPDRPRTTAGRPLVVGAALDVAPAPAVRVESGRGCCWPIGEPRTPGFRFCGKRAVFGRPYCAGHCQVAYVTVKDRREDMA